MRVLALASYPRTAAATRFRLLQMIEPLRAEGIELEVRPFLGDRRFGSLYRKRAVVWTATAIARGFLRRLADVARARRVDVVLLQREAAIVGPPVIEWLLRRVGRRPIVLDLDDPTWIAYDSPTFGRIGRLLKWPAKTDGLIDTAALVTCGGSAIAVHVEGAGTPARLVPTVVDTDLFRPADDEATGVPRLGWIGSHSTYPYLQAIVPALRAAAAQTKFSLQIVGAPPDAALVIEGADVELRPWSLATEVDDFRSIDIGLYPLGDDEWARGKSGFKAIQYLAVGVPYIATPVGAAADIGIPGETHVEASTVDEWCAGIVSLCEDVERRAAMGRAARRHSLEHYTVEQTAAKLAAALREATA